MRDLALEYAEVVDGTTLAPLATIADVGLAVVAAQVGPARLIDNMWLWPPPEPESAI